MSIWFVVFALVWVPIVCIACIVVGAYVAFCKERQLNPLRGGLLWQPQEPEFEHIATRDPDKIKGFYT